MRVGVPRARGAEPRVQSDEDREEVGAQRVAEEVGNVCVFGGRRVAGRELLAAFFRGGHDDDVAAGAEGGGLGCRVGFGCWFFAAGGRRRGGRFAFFGGAGGGEGGGCGEDVFF